MTLLIVMIAAIAVVVSLVLLTRRARAIGVMRLLGFSPSRIWMHTIGRILLVCLAISLFLGLGLLVIAGGADGTMFSRVFATTAVTLLMCMSATYGAGMVIINRVDVDDLVKGAI